MAEELDLHDLVEPTPVPAPSPHRERKHIENMLAFDQASYLRRTAQSNLANYRFEPVVTSSPLCAGK